MGLEPWRAGNSLLKFGGFDGFLWSSLFFRALEQGNGVTPPDKAQAIRMIFSEFGRVLSHLEFCSNIAFQMEAQDLFFKGLKWSQLCMDLMTSYTGNSFSIGVLAYGGVHREPPSNWFSHCMKVLISVQNEIKKEISIISKSRFWKKTETLAILQREALFRWSLAGCALRASGINYDMRKAHSYYLYKEVDFDTPIGTTGSLYDRALVRLHESVESINIINQLLDNLPTGRTVSEDAPHFSNFESPNERAKAYREAAKYEWNVADKFYHAAMEGPDGFCVLNFSLMGGKVHEPYMSSPDVNLLLCAEEVMKGQNYEDLDLVVSSLSFDQKSVERL